MTTRSLLSIGRRRRGYVIVLFAVIVAFVGIVASMQVLVLTSVGTTSRAFDAYRQGASEMTRLEHATAEAMLEAAQISVRTERPTLTDALNAKLSVLFAPAVITPETVSGALPRIAIFPDASAPADPLVALSSDLEPLLTPELQLLAGPRIATYPPIRFTFTTHRTVLDAARTYRTEVLAQLIAVPLTRFAIIAYELPHEIGLAGVPTQTGPQPIAPLGLAPGRDPAAVSILRATDRVLPYHFRRRATQAAAYQYLFSQAYIDRVAEYAGVTHFHDLDATGPTAVLAGMSKSGTQSTWDLGLAGAGTYGPISRVRDAAVLFSNTGGKTVRLRDSAGNGSSEPVLLLLLGPPASTSGFLQIEIETIARPVVIIGANVRISAAAGSGINGALFLDPTSAIAVGAPLTVGHLSYWAGSAQVPPSSVAISVMPPAAENLAPRVVHVATTSHRL